MELIENVSVSLILILNNLTVNVTLFYPGLKLKSNNKYIISCARSITLQLIAIDTKKCCVIYNHNPLKSPSPVA